MTILQECVIHIFEGSLSSQANQICDILGATTTDSIVPFFTTHVVASKITPLLRSQLGNLQTKTVDNQRGKSICEMF